MLFGRKVGEGVAHSSGETHRCSSLRSSLQNDLSQSLSVESPSMRTCALPSFDVSFHSRSPRAGQVPSHFAPPRWALSNRSSRPRAAVAWCATTAATAPTHRKTAAAARARYRVLALGVTRVSSPSRRGVAAVDAMLGGREAAAERYLPRGVRARERGHARLVLRRSAARPRSLSDVRRRTSNRCEEDGARRASAFFRGSRRSEEKEIIDSDDTASRRRATSPRTRERETMPAATKVTDVFKKRGRAPAKGKAKAKATAVTGA
jgi:hypothetical protein